MGSVFWEGVAWLVVKPDSSETKSTRQKKKATFLVWGTSGGDGDDGFVQISGIT